MSGVMECRSIPIHLLGFECWEVKCQEKLKFFLLSAHKIQYDVPLISLVHWVFKVSILRTSDVTLIFCATFCGTLSPKSQRTLGRKKTTELL